MIHDVRVQGILRALALSVSISIAALVPMGYAGVAYRDTVDSLDMKARLSAGRVARHIFAHPRLWEFQVVRLAEVIEFAAEDKTNNRQAILAKDGRVIYSEASPLPAPTVGRSTPIIVNEEVVGTLQIDTSLRPLVLETSIVALIALALAALSYGVFHRFPLRAIRRTIEQLENEQDKVRSAFDKVRASEADLLAQSSELADVQRIARLGGWSMSPDGYSLAVSQQVLDVLGITIDQAPSVATWLKRDAADSSQPTFESIVRQVVRTRDISSMDARFRRPDGHVIDLHIRMWPTKIEGNWVVRVGGTVQDVTTSKEAERKLEQLAYFDPLTSLANRTLFKRELAAEVDRLKRDGGKSYLLLLDLDRFKEVNDSQGHAAGDELLKRVAQLLQRLVPQDAFISRLGGDEFAIVLRRQRERDAAGAIAQSIVDELNQPLNIGRNEVNIGASIGIVELITDANNSETLVKYADLALYQAKERGRGRFIFFDSGMDELIQQKVMLARDLRRALADNRDLQVWLQPLMALGDKRIRGFEALIRWKHPERGYIPPMEFIPIAESSSLISDLGIWMLRSSMQIIKAWIDAGGQAYEIAVNVSPAQIWQSDLEAEVGAILRETELPPHLLCLELTESLFVDHAEGRVRQVLDNLKALGVSLALDDFGTGYSSLAYLTQLPFDKLKIDRSFVRDAPLSSKGLHVLEGIIALGHGLGMQVVAEGIENEDELTILRAAQCDLVQGYLFARPKPAAEALIEGANLVQNMRLILERDANHPRHDDHATAA